MFHLSGIYNFSGCISESQDICRKVNFYLLKWYIGMVIVIELYFNQEVIYYILKGSELRNCLNGYANEQLCCKIQHSFVVANYIFICITGS
jgi:hypothetical protein